MKTRVKAFLNQYESIRKRTKRLIKVVEPQHLDFTYKEGKFTIADQIRHIAAIERNLYAETISGRKNKYKGCGKELADGLEEILAYFNHSHEESMKLFSQLNDEDLDTYCLTPTGMEIKKGKWLELLVEHEIHHRAELYLYLNMLEVTTPPMYGLTAEEVAKM